MVIGYSSRKLVEANKTKEILFLTGVRNGRIGVPGFKRSSNSEPFAKPQKRV